jgi:hypothetical protein
MLEHQAKQLRRYGLDDGLLDARCVGGSGANLQLECFLLLRYSSLFPWWSSSDTKTFVQLGRYA